MSFAEITSRAGSELHELLTWWMDNMRDQENGGFYGRIDGAGAVHAHAEKGLILNARILWTFSAAARKTAQPEYRDIAVVAYEYLTRHFIDAEYGGVYWSADYTGAPLHTKKQVYAQAFAIYALSEYFMLGGASESLQKALEIFDLVEQHALDRDQNGYMEAYSREWVLLEDLRLSDIDANEAKTQNTHLHILEAYANLLRALQTKPEMAARAEQLKERLANLIHLFLDRFIDPETAHIHLFFDEKWRLKSDIVSFGHDIEASWLLWDAARTIGDHALTAQVKPVCIRIAEVTLAEAVDAQGAVFNQRWNKDGRLDTDRIWWVQAEAILGFWNAWEISGRKEFKDAAENCLEFTLQNMRDQSGGEWYWRISANGGAYPEEDKAGFWKCPYHNGRALLYLNDGD